MNLSLDFDTLTMNEAEFIETATGLSLDRLAAKVADEAAPKVSIMKALAAVAHARDTGKNLRNALKEVGNMPLSALNEVEVTAEGNPEEPTE